MGFFFNLCSNTFHDWWHGGRSNFLFGQAVILADFVMVNCFCNLCCYSRIIYEKDILVTGLKMKCKICGSYSRNHNCLTVNNIRRKISQLKYGFSDDMIKGFIFHINIPHSDIQLLKYR